MAKRKQESKQKLLDVAQDLMMSKGYNATTVEEVCNMADLTKGAFFYYFKTKEDLGIAVLHHYWEGRKAQFAADMPRDFSNPLEEIQGFLETVAHVFSNDPRGYSCLAGSFSQELASISPIFQQELSGLFAEWTDQIIPSLEAARELSKRHDIIQVDELADYIVSIIEGAIVLALARQDVSVIGKQVALLNQHLALVFAA